MQVFNTQVNYQNPSIEGYYGEFGGAYIPEMLFKNVETLKAEYLKIMEDPAFIAEVDVLLKDYVGRPTPLFYAERLSKEIGANIYLKREDLCHTGAHKINNTVGQIILAQRLGKKKIIAEIPREKHMKSYPAVLIGRLGVNNLIRKKIKEENTIGDQLMDFIKSWFIDKGNKTGCRFIIVDAYNKITPLNYYKRNGFIELFSSEEQEKKYINVSEEKTLSTRLLYYDLILITE